MGQVHYGWDYYEERTCRRKGAYRRKRAAEGAARTALEERNVQLWVYQCPICRWFHLTSQRPAQESV